MQGFLAAGHVCAVMGYREYEPIAEQYRVPIVVTGFEPLDLLQGIQMTVDALEEGRVRRREPVRARRARDGNPAARKILDEVFEVCDRTWRGIGVDPGQRLRPARRRTPTSTRSGASTSQSVTAEESRGRASPGRSCTGSKKPEDCTAFGTACTPEHPLGAPMVSAEGACAAYYRYARGRDR